MLFRDVSLITCGEEVGNIRINMMKSLSPISDLRKSFRASAIISEEASCVPISYSLSSPPPPQ